MREQESLVIREILNMPELGPIENVIELGSSDRPFREQWQPHILRNVHDPLMDRGARIVTTDLKDGEGIDVSGDIFDPSVQSKLKSFHADVVLCCNILEHVRDREAFAEACNRILDSGKFMIVSVPYSYPYHLDPIDTRFRPTPSQIADLFPTYTLVRGEIIKAGNFKSDLKRRRDSVARAFLRTAVRGVWPWAGVEQFKARWHRWLWLTKPFQISIALLRKDGGVPAGAGRLGYLSEARP